MKNGVGYASVLLVIMVYGQAAGMEQPPLPYETNDNLFELARNNNIRRITEIIKKVEEKARVNKMHPIQVENIIAQLFNQKEPITGNTMLHYTVLSAYISLTQFLIEKKADPTIVNEKGKSALDIANESANAHIERIVKLKPSPTRRHTVSAPELNIPDKFKEETKVSQPLPTLPTSSPKDTETTDVQFLLARQKNTDILKTIIDKLNINQREEITGNTMLHYAVLLADIPLTQLLLSNEADANIKNASGHTPCDIAKECGNPQIAGMLRRYARTTVSAPQLHIPDKFKDSTTLTPPGSPHAK